jgi:t-SNARE complex subunit (syntaxin)
MSTLLSQQAEVVDKVEDDVEAAMVDVAAGDYDTLFHQERQQGVDYQGLCAILIFFIILMRIYQE